MITNTLLLQIGLKAKQGPDTGGSTCVGVDVFDTMVLRALCCANVLDPADIRGSPIVVGSCLA